MGYPWTVRTDLSLVRPYAMSISFGWQRVICELMLVLGRLCRGHTSCLVHELSSAANPSGQRPPPARQLGWESSVRGCSSANDFIDDRACLLSCIDLGYHTYCWCALGEPSLKCALLTPLSQHQVGSLLQTPRVGGLIPSLRPKLRVNTPGRNMMLDALMLLEQHNLPSTS